MPEHRMPQSAEAEAALLGSLFFEPECIAEVVDIVVPDDFYEPSHRAVAEVIWHFWAENKPIDITLVYNEIVSRKQKKVVGGHEGLMKLADAVPEASHAAQYAQVVADKSKLRSLIGVCRNAIASAYSDDGDALTVIDTTHNEIYKLAADKERGGVLEYKAGMASELEALRSGEAIRHAVWTGFTDIDKITGGLHDGELTYLAAYSRMGKTSLALNIMEHLALKRDKKAVMFTLEVPKRQILRNLTAMGARIPVTKFRTQTLTPEDIDKLESAYNKIKENVIWVTGQPKSSLEMKAIIRQLDARFGISLVVIDYIQLFLKSQDSRAGEMSVISRQIKLMAQDLDKPFLVLSQFSRPKKGQEAKPPTLTDLKESGSLEQDADAVFLLHRLDPFKGPGEPKDHIARLHVAKQKNGPEGFVKLYFRDEILRFENFTANGENDGAVTKPAQEPKSEPDQQPKAQERLPYKEAPTHDDGTPRWVPEEDDVPF